MEDYGIIIFLKVDGVIGVLGVGVLRDREIWEFVYLGSRDLGDLGMQYIYA